MTDGAERRTRMVEDQIVARGIRDPAVLAAMRTVRREDFVPPASRAAAHDDGPLPIGFGQTMSQPFIVALMAQLAAIAPADRVLDVGTGSGYAAAVLSLLAGEVFTIEREASLAATAKARLAAGGFDRIQVRHGDGTLGWPEAQPFDAILVAAGGPRVPASLKRQLAMGGRLVMPVGRHIHHQRLIRLIRRPNGFDEENAGAVLFVPLVGEEGWDPTAVP